MSLLQKLKSLPRPLLTGLIGPIIALIAIFVAIGIAPTFSWIDNALSDLGNYTWDFSGVDPLIRALIFNIGLITTGLLVMYTTIFFFKQFEDPISKVGMLPYLIAECFLIAIGIFSENAGEIHFWVSVGFFTSFPFAFWIAGLGWLRFKELHIIALISVLLPFLSIYVWWADFAGTAFWTGAAIPEIITAMTAIGWLWVLILLERTGRFSHLLKSDEA